MINRPLGAHAPGGRSFNTPLALTVTNKRLPWPQTGIFPEETGVHARGACGAGEPEPRLPLPGGAVREVGQHGDGGAAAHRSGRDLRPAPLRAQQREGLPEHLRGPLGVSRRICGRTGTICERHAETDVI